MLHDSQAVRACCDDQPALSEGQHTEPEHEEYDYGDAEPFAHGLLPTDVTRSRMTEFKYTLTLSNLGTKTTVQ